MFGLYGLKNEVKVRNIEINCSENQVVVKITVDNKTQAEKLSKTLKDLYNKYRWLL